MIKNVPHKELKQKSKNFENQSVFQLTVVKPKPNSAMNQSGFEANTCNWRQAQENACGQNTIGFGLDSHW